MQTSFLGWPPTTSVKPVSGAAELGWTGRRRVAGRDVSRETSVDELDPEDVVVSVEPTPTHVSRETWPADTADPVSPAAVSRETSLETLPRPTATRVVTVANQKGGVGKTTTTVNIAVALAMRGLNVVVLDLDPQGNASTGLGVDHHAGVASIYDVLIGGDKIAAVAVSVPGLGLPESRLVCVPATIDLAGAEIELVSLVAREFRLQRAIAAYLGTRTGVDRVDYVLIDCPPSLGLLTVNALSAAAEVLIPIQCEYYALEGLGQLLSSIDLVRQHLNPTVAVSTILLTMYDARTRLAEQVAQEVRDHFGDTVLRTIIPRSVRVSEAPSYRQSVMTYDPSSRGARSYLDAAREIAVRTEVERPPDGAGGTTDDRTDDRTDESTQKGGAS